MTTVKFKSYLETKGVTLDCVQLINWVELVIKSVGMEILNTNEHKLNFLIQKFKLFSNKFFFKFFRWDRCDWRMQSIRFRWSFIGAITEIGWISRQWRCFEANFAFDIELRWKNYCCIGKHPSPISAIYLYFVTLNVNNELWEWKERKISLMH